MAPPILQNNNSEPQLRLRVQRYGSGSQLHVVAEPALYGVIVNGAIVDGDTLKPGLVKHH